MLRKYKCPLIIGIILVILAVEMVILIKNKNLDKYSHEVKFECSSNGIVEIIKNIDKEMKKRNVSENVIVENINVIMDDVSHIDRAVISLIDTESAKSYVFEVYQEKIYMDSGKVSEDLVSHCTNKIKWNNCVEVISELNQIETLLKDSESVYISDIFLEPKPFFYENCQYAEYDMGEITILNSEKEAEGKDYNYGIYVSAMKAKENFINDAYSVSYKPQTQIVILVE